MRQESLYGSLWLLLITAITFCAYWSDKIQARLGGRRFPENTLLLLGFLGGTLGAIVAMRCFRHKTSKRTFLWKFAAVTAFQMVALAGYIGIER